MDVTAISQLIGSVGFPIVAACGMFYLYYKTVTDMTTILTKIDTTLNMLTTELKLFDSNSKDSGDAV